MIRKFLEIDLQAIKAQTHASLSAMRGILRYYETDQDTSLLKAVEKRYALYKKEAMTENFENYNWFGRPEWTEPCAVIDSYILTMWLWKLTGNPVYLEDAHKIYYNGMCFEQRANGGFGCDNCTGADGCMLYAKVDEAHWCCTMRGGEGLSRVAQFQAFKSPEAIWFTQYENGVYSFAYDKDTLSFKENNMYPYAGKVYLEVQNNSLPFTPAIKLFAPSWISDPVISVNGNIIKFGLANNFISFTSDLKEGDFIEYTFKIRTQKTMPGNANSIKGYNKYMYGPLLMGYIGKEPLEVSGDIVFEPITKELFRIKDTKLLFNPVCHLMNPNVKMKDFTMQVMFNE